MNLHALALVDAGNINRYYIQETAGTVWGEDLVRTTREGYIGLFGAAPSNTFALTVYEKAVWEVLSTLEQED